MWGEYANYVPGACEAGVRRVHLCWCGQGNTRPAARGRGGGVETFVFAKSIGKAFFNAQNMAELL